VSIDASGEIIGSSDPALAGSFDGVVELGARLAASDQVLACAVTQWFRFAHGRDVGDDDATAHAQLTASFAASRNIKELLVALTQTVAFRYRTPISP